MARLVPGAMPDTCVCNGKASSPQPADEDNDVGGCGSTSGRAGGGEMAAMEKQLKANNAAEEAGLETEITTGRSDNARSSGPKSNEELPKNTPSNSTKQKLGTCERCGYMSSQRLCQACMLLDGLNKNRPKIII
ncbi:hypothetical protein RRF57_001861 [Xylaria bambusicola]|uniref:Cytoplasmic tRNA 2-thiolation protein 1 C-terminal domain-containing protein n=1 Tax=Xylaria bambusicola TaxID=326684 RepID=A0AAN7UHU9_9PEZI